MELDSRGRTQEAVLAVQTLEVFHQRTGQESYFTMRLQNAGGRRIERQGKGLARS